ncbi:MAG TPA: polysaccharide deacetylase family protein [Chitinophaga sp.]|uniref:polysaccharide deacetylase family protein n=1 Tax=Chitinophaga sp. TaxID=1869181 RepID=UPI002BBF31EF|nr:polysaccharide deacetylase family protein [Chitinophaga sp.]HVI47602.1 polysaccharide deacetylase family protein [Chitinophaga sp.]
MLNKRAVNIICISAILVLLVLRITGRYAVPVWMFLLPVLLCLPFYVWGAANIRSGFFIQTFCNADTAEKVVALSFDDGPHTELTPQILDVLATHKVPAAFFCIGKNIEGNNHLLQRIHADGHVIGNHTYSHDYWFDVYSRRKMEEDMEKMDSVTINATGLQPRLFRPPYGVTNPNLAGAIRSGNYLAIGWNIRSMDTVAQDADRLLQRVMNGLRPGAVILLHDTQEITAGILAQLIEGIHKKGYRFERIDKMLNVPAYV